MYIAIGKFLSTPHCASTTRANTIRGRERKREIEEDGCILVRPDRFIAWRSMSLRDDCEEKLGEVLKKVLGQS
jgi:hypothetical protein